MKRDNKHQSTDRRGENGMMLAELKHLKAQLVIKDARIKQLEGLLADALNKIKDAQDAQKPVVQEVLKALENPTLAKVVGS